MSAVIQKTGSRKARQSSARLFAVQALYQSLHQQKSLIDVMEEFLQYNRPLDLNGGDGDEAPMVSPDETLFKSICAGVSNRFSELAQFIDPHLIDFEKRDFLIQSIILCGVYEILAHTDIDRALIISEYINITKAFYHGTESKLVNAVLDKFER